MANRYDPPSLSINQFLIPKVVCPVCGSRLDYDILFETPWCGCRICSCSTVGVNDIFLDPLSESKEIEIG